MSYLQKAFELLEKNGFHVSRAYEENHRDAGNEVSRYENTTGAIWFRVIPKENEQVAD
jgi:hypothetical protein